MATSNTNSTVHRWPSPLKMYKGADGHNYYLINDEDSRGIANVTFVEYYSSLGQYAPSKKDNAVSNPTGFYFVRDAASTGADHYGDATVHKGWAMYIWDTTKFDQVSMNSGWVKIAQQTDIDWDIDDELKAMFVLKSVYNVKMNEIDGNIAIINNSLINLGDRVTNVENDININVKPYLHIHLNKEDVLDKLSTQYNTLYFDGRPIGGNSYVYDRTKDGEIYWVDPTSDSAQTLWKQFKNDETSLTSDSEVYQVKNAAEIASLFSKCALARIGLSLIIVEPDGSLTIHKFTREEPDGTMVPTFADAETIDSSGVVSYITLLPTATKFYYQRGYWVPLQDDGEHTVGHLHYCEEYTDSAEPTVLKYRWVDASSTGEELNVSGSAIDVCYADDATLWTRVHLHCSIPDDTTVTLANGVKRPVKWASTTIVRKFGSAPENMNDGVTVVKFTDREKALSECYIDIVPNIATVGSDRNVTRSSYDVTDAEETEGQYYYYRAFTMSKSGDYYKSTDAKPSKKMDWGMMHQFADDGVCGLVFKVGDTVMLPHHNTYGDIECDVVAVNTGYLGNARSGILLATRKSLRLVMDAAESVYTINTSGMYANPEAVDYEDHGSNGLMVNGKHNLATMNIMRFLNCQYPSGYYWDMASKWDLPATYTMTGNWIGLQTFLDGFEDSSVFSSFETETLKNGFVDDSQFVDFSFDTQNLNKTVKVMLPYIGDGSKSWIDNLTSAKKTKRPMTDPKTTAVMSDFVTLTPAKLNRSDCARVNFGFMPLTAGVVCYPEVDHGIIPMFFIGKTES